MKIFKLGPKCQYFVWPPLFSSTALTILGMEFTRASQVATGVLFHSSLKTTQSWWMLETLRSSTFRLRMPQRCSIEFRSGNMLGQSITFTLSFFNKAVVVLEVCLGWLSCWNTALRPSLQREGIILFFSMSQYMQHVQCAAYGMSTDRLTPYPFNLCRKFGSTHTSISQTQPLDMMLSTCSQLLWSC